MQSITQRTTESDAQKQNIQHSTTKQSSRRLHRNRLKYRIDVAKPAEPIVPAEIIEHGHIGRREVDRLPRHRRVEVLGRARVFLVLVKKREDIHKMILF